MTYIGGIFSRTIADIENHTHKAYFNVEDWNRIYGNALAVVELIQSMHGITIAFDTITPPTVNDFPQVADFNKLLSNIERTRENLGSPTTEVIPAIKANWLEGINQSAPNYEDVNTWERALDILYASILAYVEYVVYCGVANVGQPRFYQHRFRQSFAPISMFITRSSTVGSAITGSSFTRQNGFRRV